MRNGLPLPIGFIGAGNMAEALSTGILAKDLALPGDIYLSDVKADRLEDLRHRFGMRVARSNLDLVRHCKTVLFAVKPQNVREVLKEIGPAAPVEPLFVTICAGVSTRIFEEMIPGARVVRAMPNTPAFIGRGATAIAPGANATREDMESARLLFDAVGVCVEVEEAQLDAVTGLTGSGPAYIYYMIECLIEAGREQGLSDQHSYRMVKQMALGAAMLAFESPKRLEELRQQVTTPGGTTAAGLEELRKGDFAGLIKRCVARATERSRELGKMV